MYHTIYLTIAVVPYYFNPNIHNLGNIGFGGKIHATLCPIATKLIDKICYNNIDIRNDIIKDYKEYSILDMCCGVGTSTKEYATGIDTSPEMINMAKLFNKKSNFEIANAENYKPSQSYDVVSCMFAFHEMPLDAQLKVINNAINIADKEVIIVDISTNYNPKEIMLTGEPYLLDYLTNIDSVLSNFDKINYIDNHVNIWKLIK